MDIIFREKMLEELFKLEDPGYREFHTKLIPGADKTRFIGIRMPILRKYIKKLSKDGKAEAAIENILSTFAQMPEKIYYEERLICGILIGTSVKDYDRWQQLIKRFVPLIDNWAVCDGACASMKIASEYREKTWDFMKDYLYDEREYHIRFGVVMLMDWFIDNEHIDLVLAEMEKVKTDDYYAMMAVAWALSVCFVKFPDKTMRLIEAQNLDIRTHNKTIQKIRESLRVDNEIKKELLAYRR